MEIIYYPDDGRPTGWAHPVLTIGNFDGVHRGHAKIIAQVQHLARIRSATSAVLTFDPHPPRIVRPDKAPQLLMTESQKFEALELAGIDAVGVVRFTPEVAHWEPDHFVQEILVDWLRVTEVCVGANFLFGRDRQGNFSLLRSLGKRHGFRVENIAPVRYKEFVVSSTRARRLVTDGRVDEAGALLGHHYFIDGKVVEGAGRGRGQSVPTANLQTDNELVPPNGVYATTVILNGIIHPAVTNVGVRPTFEISGDRTIEAHLFDYEGDFYGAEVRLAFVQRLRNEQAFPDVKALRRQIADDCAHARTLFASISL